MKRIGRELPGKCRNQVTHGKEVIASMRKNRLLWIAVIAVLFSLLIPRPAYAYIDPGTTSSIFAMLAPFVVLILAFLGFLIRPFRRFFSSLFTKLRGSSGAESIASDEQSVSDEPSDDEKS